MNERTEHTQSTLTAAANWNEVVRDLAELGMDPRDVTPEWLIALARDRLRIGAGYFMPEYAGLCYFEVQR
jgi:hypothetical protein